MKKAMIVMAQFVAVVAVLGMLVLGSAAPLGDPGIDPGFAPAPTPSLTPTVAG